MTEAQPPKRRRAKGGGRKPLPEGNRKIERHLMIEPHILAAVDAYASEHEKSRSASVNELLATALQNYRPSAGEGIESWLASGQKSPLDLIE